MITLRRFHFGSALILLLTLFTVLGFGESQGRGVQDTVTFAMCQPTKKQIRNIEVMVEKDVISLEKIHLIGVYHEDELTDYQPAHDYVKEQGLSWVEFQVIRGKVEVPGLFRENAWTPQFQEVFNRTKGIIFTGGEDIPPVVYWEENHLTTEGITPIRSFYEVSFLFHLLGGSQNPGFKPLLDSRKDYVILGICLGCQTMNVACGGTLVQDIPAQVYHLESMEQVLKMGVEQIHSARYVKYLHPIESGFLAPAFHPIRISEGSILTNDLGMKVTDYPQVLSSHHQALKALGKNLEVIAVSMDGKVVEAIQHQIYKNVLGVQFHPEPLELYQKAVYYRKEPGGPMDFNLRKFLQANPPSWDFHQRIWAWFSRQLAH